MQKFKKISIIVLGISVLLFITGRYFYYGSLFRNCIYTQEKINLPEKITNGYFVTVKDASLIDMEKEYRCLSYFKNTNIDFLLAQKEASWFHSENKAFVSGKRLKMIDIVSVTKHGINTIDSGSGPNKFYIVEDEFGAKHAMWIPINNEDYFALFFSSSSTAGLPINYDNFKKLLK